MIFVYFDLLRIDAVAAFVLLGATVTALIAGISFHEFSHAYVADSLGDRLPRSRGRVTLNPLAHLDPAGTVLLFIVGFGWGKPVPVNPAATRNPKASLAIVAGAGPISNFIVAALAGFPLKAGWVPWLPPFNVSVMNSLIRGGWSADQYLGLYLSAIVLVSLILGVFNLIPIAPLDGFRVTVGLLPRELSRSFAELERWGPVILIALIALPFLTGGNFGILFEVMRPIINALARLFAGIRGDAFA
ncbi:MAG: site-2 protease family protein [Chloroflexi bacterium]|nr:site-2 protease family protein [Chloroflexota bacterium]